VASSLGDLFYFTGVSVPYIIIVFNRLGLNCVSWFHYSIKAVA